MDLDAWEAREAAIALREVMDQHDPSKRRRPPQRYEQRHEWDGLTVRLVDVHVGPAEPASTSEGARDG